MKNKLLTLSLIASVSTIVNSHAQSIKFDNPISASVTITNPQNKSLLHAKKEVKLMSIRLTETQKQNLLHPKILKHVSKSDTSSLPPSINLGMNNVPVLDQGIHGTCVTFAVTAAIDAVLEKGDYASQLCQLELGSYLKYKGYFTSGWDGTFATSVYDQMLRFGIVSKHDIEKTQGCAGIKAYPATSLNEGNIMTPEEYRYVSEDISELIHPHTHMDIVDRFNSKFSDIEAAERTLISIKTALANGNRVTFGTMLVMLQDCDAGACVTYKEKNDTWAYVDDVQANPLGLGGHEMVIMGYDDNAIVTDKHGKQHQGLFMLRNSWGADVGDKGNYYMTYEYFKIFFTEAHEVVKISQGNN